MRRARFALERIYESRDAASLIRPTAKLLTYELLSADGKKWPLHPSATFLKHRWNWKTAGGHGNIPLASTTCSANRKPWCCARVGSRATDTMKAPMRMLLTFA